MKQGNIISQDITPKSAGTHGKFNIEFAEKSFGPYTHLFRRENLYFNEEVNERGSFFFPLNEKIFNNTEIFLEIDSIIVALGERGSFSGNTKLFLEIVNLETGNKYRFYPEQVSLIYNTENEIIIYCKDEGEYKKIILSQEKLEKISEEKIYLDAFFKLFYNHTTQKYGRLIFESNSNSSTHGYFKEENITSLITKPISFHREKFSIACDGYDGEDIDIWEASLTGEL